ncbi:MAG: AtpZ/AtpI family protein [Vicinamibacterales bacterium]
MADQPDRRTRVDTIRTLGALSTVGISFVLAVLLGGGFGYWLDRVFKFEKYPVFFLIFFGLGSAAGMINVFRASKKLK